MNRGVLATAGLVLPPILLHRLWSGRRSSILSETIEDVSPEKGSSSLPLPIGEYEVFLNFRGPDTRHQITDILYRFLVNLKIRTFKDDEEIRKGEAFPPSLAKAIEQSKIFVAIFSKNYAHSKWCLGELAAFVERKEQEKGRIILPIFYLVDPRDVRCQTGPFEKAFQQHEKKFDEKTRHVWKDAMAKVGALEGWHIKSNDDFVENIRGRLQQKDGVVNLQKHIISDIMRTRYADSIVNIGEGMRILKDRISCFKFLIVLDDVDEEFGFSEIFGKIEHNVSGSRFIVTSRDVKVLGTLTEESKLYRVREMNHDHALQLFSKYAFRKDSPPSSHETLSKDIVAVAAGLPLTVKVGTNLVEGIRLNEFSEELGKECFMNLSELRYLDAKVKSLTGDCSMYLPNLRWLQLKIRTGEVLPKFSMENLVVLELLSPMKDDCGSLMHIKMANKLKVLKVFGHYGLTSFPEFPQSQSLEILHLLYFGSMSSPKDLDIGNLRNLNELQLRSCKVRKIRGGTIGMLKGLRVLEFRDFYCRKNLREVLADIGVLQFLEILRVDVKNGGAEYLFPWRNLLLGIKLPTSLKVLRTSSPVANLPELLDLEEMTVEDCDTFGLELPPADGDSNMWWKLSKLKSLKIKRTKLSLPTRLLLPSSLTTLHILECQELDWLPSLENLENVTQLIISSCPLIKEIPGLGSLLSLTKLSLVGCKAMERLPSLASLSKLDELFTSACPLVVEIQGLGGLKSLQHLTIDSAENLTRLLGFGNLLFFNKLETITITNCPLLTSLSFHDLDDGDDGCGDCQLPAVLCSLRYLSISGTMLVLDILCQMLQLAQFPSLLTFSLKVMGIDNVDVELPLEWIGSMEKLAELTLSGLVSVWKLPFLSKLRNLKKLTIAGAPNLQEVEELAGLKSLEHIKLTGCTSLQRLPADDLSSLKQLQSIDISDCANLADQFTPRKTNLTALIRWEAVVTMLDPDMLWDRPSA
ncbi:unnamed protein product [Linum tenue]|uniref:TIR domain-containing protein n=1 Tax=Linum tenue TaxID=586396 RepID=A0AAV0K6B8_9ROSI|nr:unnamed protein product [Linum tenue]